MVTDRVRLRIWYSSVGMVHFRVMFLVSVLNLTSGPSKRLT